MDKKQIYYRNDRRMIRGNISRDEGIPLENIETPLEYFTNQIKKPMSKFLPVGTYVIATHAGTTDPQHGRVGAVDEEDTRTVFPYLVNFDSGVMAWVKETDIKQIAVQGTSETTDNAPNFILGVALIIAFFYCTIGGCTACNSKPIYTPQPLVQCSK